MFLREVTANGRDWLRHYQEREARVQPRRTRHAFIEDADRVTAISTDRLRGSLLSVQPT